MYLYDRYLPLEELARELLVPTYQAVPKNDLNDLRPSCSSSLDEVKHGQVRASHSNDDLDFSNRISDEFLVLKQLDRNIWKIPEDNIGT